MLNKEIKRKKTSEYLLVSFYVLHFQYIHIFLNLVSFPHLKAPNSVVDGTRSYSITSNND